MPETGQNVEPYIGRSEVARRVGVVPGTVDQWVMRGVLRHFRFGRVLRFKWSLVDADLVAWGLRPKPASATTENTKNAEVTRGVKQEATKLTKELPE